MKTKTNSYLNPWHKDLLKHGIRTPAVYENTARCVYSSGPWSVYRISERHFDYVKDGVCVTQRAGLSGGAVQAENVINQLESNQK